MADSVADPAGGRKACWRAPAGKRPLGLPVADVRIGGSSAARRYER